MKKRSLSENERAELKSLNYLMKYILSKPKVEDLKVLEVLEQFQEIAKMYNFIKENEINELFDCEDLKSLVEKLFVNFENWNRQEQK